MEMEDHSQHHEQHQLQHHSLPDLRQLLMNGPSILTNMQPPSFTIHDQFFSDYQDLLLPLVTTTITNNLISHDLHYEFGDIGGGNSCRTMTTTTSVSTPPPPPPSSSGLLLASEGARGGCTDGDASTGKWHRQETLTLLEIRSRLDPKFKEANHKGPLWEEVSRIMCQEHGYQRSGKTCKEKFENLYKYYKMTKNNNNDNGITKHYRFFHHLESIFGKSSKNFGNGNKKHFGDDSSEFDDTSITSSPCGHNKRKKRKSDYYYYWKELIDSEMRKIFEKQEEWLEKVVKVFEEKENERVLREQEWRKKEEIRFENEHKFWAKRRELIEARDSFLIDALNNKNKKKLEKRIDYEMVLNDVNNNSVVGVGGYDDDDLIWEESDEIATMLQQSVVCCSEEEVLSCWEEKGKFEKEKGKSSSSSNFI